MILGSVPRIMRITMIGTDTTPFTIADQISAFIESTPERSMSTPSTVAII